MNPYQDDNGRPKPGMRGKWLQWRTDQQRQELLKMSMQERMNNMKSKFGQYQRMTEDYHCTFEQFVERDGVADLLR